MRYVTLLVIIATLCVSIALVRRTDAQAQYFCTDTYLSSVAGSSYTSGTDGSLILGSTGIFPRDYYFSSTASILRVEVLDLVAASSTYSPILGIFGARSFVGDIGTFFVPTPYNSQYALRIQTQHGSFRVRVSECTFAPPTPTPAPSTPTPSPTAILQYPTPTPGYGLALPCTSSGPRPTPTPDVPVLAGGGPGLMAFSVDPGDGGGGGGGGGDLPPDLLPGTLPFPTADVTLCDNFSDNIRTYAEFRDYENVLSSSIRPVVNDFSFVARTCYVLIPSLELPALPALGVQGGVLIQGLQACVNTYNWNFQYDNIDIDAVVISLIVFVSFWSLFMMFRSG